MKYLLFTVIESDINDGHKSQWYNSQHHKISYEQEAIQCFKSWRSLNHELKDINIICINPTNIDISDSTKQIFNDLNIDYRFEYNSTCDSFKCRWYNVPYLGSLLEQEIDGILIHIDLDMTLLKPLSSKLLNLMDDELAIVGAYDDDNMMDKRNFKIYKNNYEKINVTCYIVSNAKNNFYTIWWNKLHKESQKIDPDKHWREYCDMEEHSVDILKYKDKYNIRYVDQFMLGPGYTSLIKNPELKNEICFIHAHEFQNKFKYYEEYIKC